jgi:hypothetical protein
MLHGPGRGRRGGEESIGLSDTMRVHVTERDVMVLLTNDDWGNDDWGQIRFPQESGSDPGGIPRTQAVYALMHTKKRGYRGPMATVETVPWNLIRLIPA